MPDEAIPDPDDSELGEVIAAYLDAVDAGKRPDPEGLIARHPHLAEELRAFLAAEGRLRRLAEPFRDPDGEGLAAVETIDDSPHVTPADGSRVALTATVGEYELLEKLGEGGMGVVYKARHPRLKRVVALKMIRAADAREVDLARFRIEAEAIARLQHPGIVQVYEVGEHLGMPFLALEFCDGGSLAGELRGGPAAPARAAKMVRQLAEAVEAAHRGHVVHRDLKPGNVLRTADGKLKVSDFGLAKKLDEAEGLTRTEAVMGTPAYMAPEQARGQSSQAGPACDVYALGAILYHMLTGRPPFRGPTTADILHQVVHDEPARPRRIDPKVPRDLETVCLKCLEKDPTKRYASAKALSEELQRFVDGVPVRARPVGRAERAWRWCKRYPEVSELAATVLLVLLAGTGVSVRYALKARANEITALNLAGEKDALFQQATALAGSEKSHAGMRWRGRWKSRNWQGNSH